MTISPRNACPTLADPMRTGDGWLARLPPLLKSMRPADIAGLAQVAARHGNGLIEISKRGNFQIRGLSEHGGPALAADLADRGFDLPSGLPISADPLSDLAPPLPLDPSALADSIHAGIEAAGLTPRLAPKLSIVLDFATAFRPAGLSADIRFRFGADHADIGLGGDDASADWIGSVPPESVVDAALAILSRLADLGPTARLAGSGEMSGSESFTAAARSALGESLEPGSRSAGTRAPAFAGAMEGWVAGSCDGHPGGEQISVHPIAFPFGQADSDSLAALADAAERAGIAAIAPAPERRLLFAGPVAAVRSLADAAARLGFITEGSDPRRFISACIGTEGCASGRLPGRKLADDVARAAPSLFDGTFSLHLSGCPKGCAHPEPARLAFVGVDKGASVVLEGRARDDGFGFAAVDTIAGRMAELASEIARRQRPGETMAGAIGRMGKAGLAPVLTERARDEWADRGREAELGGKASLG